MSEQTLDYLEAQALTERAKPSTSAASEILSEVEDASGMAGELQNTLRGRLRISAPSLFGARRALAKR